MDSCFFPPHPAMVVCTVIVFESSPMVGENQSAHSHDVLSFWHECCRTVDPPENAIRLLLLPKTDALFVRSTLLVHLVVFADAHVPRTVRKLC